VLGLDVAPGGAFAAIVAVGERDGHLHAAALDHGEGTEWLMGALERRFQESAKRRLC
jgi:hypothetical protein